MKVFVLYMFVELIFKKLEIVDDSGNCMVYFGKLIKVYCFDYEKFGCNFCLILEYKDCKMVLVLDEIDESDLDNFFKSFIRELKKMRDLIILVM